MMDFPCKAATSGRGPDDAYIFHGPLARRLEREITAQHGSWDPRTYQAARRTAEEFEVCATVPLIVSDDVDASIDALRPFYALYFGGMGARSANFHANVPIRMGYENEVKQSFLTVYT